MDKTRAFKRITNIIAVAVLMIGIGVFIGKPVDAYASQSRTGETTETLSVTYKDYAGVHHTLTFDIKCTYTAVWDEGYGGYISEAIFWNATNAHVGNTPVYLEKVYNTTQSSGDYKWMNYKINKIVFSVYIGVDEWGDVRLWVDDLVILK